MMIVSKNLHLYICQGQSCSEKFHKMDISDIVIVLNTKYVRCNSGVGILTSRGFVLSVVK